MKKVALVILALALVLTSVASSGVARNETMQSYQLSAGQLSYAVGGTVLGCVAGIAGGVATVACFGGASTPITFWAVLGCSALGVASIATIIDQCF